MYLSGNIKICDNGCIIVHTIDAKNEHIKVYDASYNNLIQMGRLSRALDGQDSKFQYFNSVNDHHKSYLILSADKIFIDKIIIMRRNSVRAFKYLCMSNYSVNNYYDFINIQNKLYRRPKTNRTLIWEGNPNKNIILNCAMFFNLELSIVDIMYYIVNLTLTLIRYDYDLYILVR